MSRTGRDGYLVTVPLIPETRRLAEGSEFHIDDPHISAVSAHQVRQHLTRWMAATLPTSNERRTDIELAVYEAVANAVEHAYCDLPQPGTVLVAARYRHAKRSLHITVTDHGTWKPPNPTRSRGRGLALINALCQSPDITTGPTGTTVSLHWRLFS